MSASTNWNFEAMLEDLDDDDVKQVKDVAALIYAGLDQMRTALDMPWQAVSHKGMVALSQQLAILTADWKAAEGLLAGSWMAASSRAQIEQSQVPAPADG